MWIATFFFICKRNEIREVERGRWEGKGEQGRVGREGGVGGNWGCMEEGFLGRCVGGLLGEEVRVG